MGVVDFTEGCLAAPFEKPLAEVRVQQQVVRVRRTGVTLGPVKRDVFRRIGHRRRAVGVGGGNTLPPELPLLCRRERRLPPRRGRGVALRGHCVFHRLGSLRHRLLTRDARETLELRPPVAVTHISHLPYVSARNGIRSVRYPALRIRDYAVGVRNRKHRRIIRRPVRDKQDVGVNHLVLKHVLKHPVVHAAVIDRRERRDSARNSQPDILGVFQILFRARRPQPEEDLSGARVTSEGDHGLPGQRERVDAAEQLD